MNVAVSTQLYDEARLDQVRPLLEQDAALGVEIFPEWQLTRYEPLQRQALPWLEGRAITLHGPYWDIDPCFDPGEPEFALFLKYWHKTLDLARQLRARYVVYHLYNHHFAAWEREEKLAAARRSLDCVRELAAEYGVLLAIENTETSRDAGENLLTQEEYVQLVRSLPDCAAMIDVGHAHCAGWDIPQLIRELADRIEGYHLHNNDGTDSHCRLREGTLDMEQVLALICRHTPRAALTLEYNPRLGIRREEVWEDILWLRCCTEQAKKCKENTR